MRFIRSAWILLLLLPILLTACEPFFSPSNSPSQAGQDQTFAPAEPGAPDPQAQPPAQSFFQGPLSVILTRPEDNAVVTASPVLIEGEADPGTVISLNDALVVVDSSRKFSLLFPLQPGINAIEIVASDAEDQQDFRFFTLTLEDPPAQ